MKAWALPDVGEQRLRKFNWKIAIKDSIVIFLRPPKKPSFKLGFLLAMVLYVFLLVLISTEKSDFLVFFSSTSCRFKICLSFTWFIENFLPTLKFSKSEWIGLWSAFAAIVGFLVSAIISIRNAVGMHTMTTLLDSRMSSTYMEHAAVVNSNFFIGKRICKITKEEVENGFCKSSVSYIMNYLEYLSVGVRYGEIDEKILKKMHRGVICNFYEAFEEYIKFYRSSGNKTIFENLEWLYIRWRRQALSLETCIRKEPEALPQAVEATREVKPVDAMYALITGRLPRK